MKAVLSFLFLLSVDDLVFSSEEGESVWKINRTRKKLKSANAEMRARVSTKNKFILIFSQEKNQMLKSFKRAISAVAF